jgi:hypothetical protein
MRYAESERAPAQRSTDGGATVHRVEIAAREHAPVADVLGASLNQSPRSQALIQLRQALDESPRVQGLQGLAGALNVTRAPEDEEPEQLPQDARSAAAQLAAMPDDAGKPDDPPPVSAPLQKKPNATGLPDRLKAGVESLSGFAMDDVRVHYNSSKPAAVQAHAYALGADIHVAPGQEQHLPHEAWHVVQQKQGRVKPTLQMKGVAINDDAGLEREADGMGRMAVTRPPAPETAVPLASRQNGQIHRTNSQQAQTSALDEGPRVQSQLALQRALNRTRVPETDGARLPQDSNADAVLFAAMPGAASKPDEPAAPTPVQKKPQTSQSDVLQLRAANLGGAYQQTDVVLPVYFANGFYANNFAYSNDLGHFNTVPDFVRGAAAEAGRVGSIQEIAAATSNTSNANAAAAGAEKWIISSEDMGAHNKPHSIEPFNIKLEGQYAGANTAVSMTYHFGNFNNGYIMAQSDSVTTAAITGYAGAADNAREYSNVHENTDDVRDQDINARMTGDLAQGATWDARTILGGEGARFVPVRDLQQNGTLANTSRFFTGRDANARPAQGDDLVAAITLADLWGIWTRRFPGLFNVTNAQMAAVLQRFSQESSDRIDLLEYRDMVSGSDFDLDRNAVVP